MDYGAYKVMEENNQMLKYLVQELNENKKKDEDKKK